MTEPNWSEGDEIALQEACRSEVQKWRWYEAIVGDRRRILTEIAKHNDVPAHVLRWLVPLVAEGRKP